MKPYAKRRQFVCDDSENYLIGVDEGLADREAIARRTLQMNADKSTSHWRIAW